MNKIQKPEWLPLRASSRPVTRHSSPVTHHFAEKLRVRIDNMKPTKSGKREADTIYRAWLEATQTLAYQGSPYDWQCLYETLGDPK